MIPSQLLNGISPQLEDFALVNPSGPVQPCIPGASPLALHWRCYIWAANQGHLGQSPAATEDSESREPRESGALDEGCDVEKQQESTHQNPTEYPKLPKLFHLIIANHQLSIGWRRWHRPSPDRTSAVWCVPPSCRFGKSGMCNLASRPAGNGSARVSRLFWTYLQIDLSCKCQGLMLIQTFTQKWFLAKKCHNCMCCVCVCVGASIWRAAIFGLLLKFRGRRGQNVMR